MNNSQTKSSGYNKMQRRLIVSMSLSGSLLLPLALSGSLSGSLWLSLALSGCLWLALAHSGSLWLAVRLSLARCPALSGSLWLSLALSGSLLLSKFAYQALARLGTSFLSSSTLISPDIQRTHKSLFKHGSAASKYICNACTVYTKTYYA